MSSGGVVVHEGCDHIFFVGFSGAGKSTVARTIGSLFRRKSVDIDRLLERREHASIAELWERAGERGFRELEGDVLSSLRAQKSLLVSAGGGTVELERNRRLMHELGKVVFLDGTLEDSLAQLQNWDRRPDLSDLAGAREAYLRRRPIYEAMADYRVSITGKTFEEVACDCVDLLWQKGLL